MAGSKASGNVRIYHNPNCTTSRNVLGMIRDKDIEPEVIEYLKTPPTRQELKDMLAKMGLSVREVLRKSGTPFEELGLDAPSLSDEQIFDAIEQHPILIQRPIVVTEMGVRLCRPKEKVLEVLPA